jgi:hypothetical protein
MSQPVTAVRRALVAAAIVVGLAACGGNDTPSADGSPPAGSANRESAPLSFSGELLGGGRLEGSSLAGKAVMLWFWAPT